MLLNIIIIEMFLNTKMKSSNRSKNYFLKTLVKIILYGKISTTQMLIYKIKLKKNNKRMKKKMKNFKNFKII